MSDYPGAIDDFRTIENIPNQTYDVDKTTTIYAEDLTALDEAVVAIENTLGTDPQGAFDTVSDRIANIEGDFTDGKLVPSKGGTGSDWSALSTDAVVIASASNLPMYGVEKTDNAYDYLGGDLEFHNLPPWICSFKNHVDSQTVTSSTGLLKYDTSDYGSGSGYDTSTGVFTAPVSGVYIFNAGINVEANSSITRAFIEFVFSDYAIRGDDFQATRVRTVQASCQVYMAEGDTMSVHAYATASVNVGSDYTFLSGVLVRDNS